MSDLVRVDRSLVVEDATLIFKNFAGLEGKYNRAGDRSFSLLLPPDLADRLHREGWNVKQLRVREEGDTPQAHIHVAVAFDKGRPPKITMVTSKGKTPIDEDMCNILDWIDIETVDLILNPYNWSVNGNSGIKAYLKTMYVVIHEDYLDMKYRDLDDYPARAGRAIESGPSYIDGEVVEDD